MSKDPKISLDELGFSNTEIINITEVPDEFVGTVDHYRIERDENGINRIKLYVNYNDKIAVISYTRIYLGFLADQLKKMGIIYLDDIKGKTFKFKRMPTTAKLKRKVNYNLRHVPIQLIKTDVSTLKDKEAEEEQEEEEEEQEEEDNVSKLKSKFKSKQ